MAPAMVSTMPGGSCLAADTWIRSANAFWDSRREKSWKVFSASTANASGASRCLPWYRPPVVSPSLASRP